MVRAVLITALVVGCVSAGALFLLRAPLLAALSARTGPMAAPRLELDSLCVCADGALIGGFVDDERGSFASLRAACHVSPAFTRD